MSQEMWMTLPFLGFSVENHAPIGGTPEDTVGVVGPPRCGKSSGVLIPTLLTWGGPAVATSTRADLVSATADRRLELAQRTNGKVWVYDPFRSDVRFRSMHWSPLVGCKDASLCNHRVSVMAAAASKGAQDEEYWKSNTARILRPLFYAAALNELPLAKVVEWLDNEGLAKEAVAYLRVEGSPIAQQWASGLDGILDSDPKTRDPLFATARSTLEAAADPLVLDSCSKTDLDVQEFLNSGSTLYIIGPSHKQQVIAPLIAALVDSIAHAATDLAAKYSNGRLQFPLLLALDEVANIAPLESLPALVSEGGGRGIITVWAAQNLAQLRDRYTPEKAKSVLAATGAKLIFGGLTISEDLREISAWAGEKMVPTDSISKTPTGLFTQQVTRSTSMERVPVLDVGQLQQLPVGVAALFYRSHPLQVVRIIPAGADPTWAPMLGCARFQAAQSAPAVEQPRPKSNQTPREQPRETFPPRPERQPPAFTPSPPPEREGKEREQPRQPQAEFVPSESKPVPARPAPKADFLPPKATPSKPITPSPLQAQFVRSEPTVPKSDQKPRAEFIPASKKPKPHAGDTPTQNRPDSRGPEHD